MELVSIEDRIVSQDVVVNGIPDDSRLSDEMDRVYVIVSVVREGGEKVKQ